MSRLYQLLRNALLLGTILSISGAHWLGLQGYAWANMIWERSAEAPLWDVVAETLDGQKPCHLCQSIARAQSTPESERELPQQNRDQTLTLFFHFAPLTLHPPQPPPGAHPESAFPLPDYVAPILLPPPRPAAATAAA